MSISTTIVAVLLFLVALLILADACRSMSLLHRRNRRGSTHDREQFVSVSSPLDHIEFRLSDEDRDGFFAMWHSIRQEFDLNPRATVLHADLLISDLIEDTVGSPVQDWEGVKSPESQLKRVFKSAHEIALRTREGRARPYELKRAITLYAALFDELLANIETVGRRN